MHEVVLLNAAIFPFPSILIEFALNYPRLIIQTKVYLTKAFVQFVFKRVAREGCGCEMVPQGSLQRYHRQVMRLPHVARNWIALHCNLIEKCQKLTHKCRKEFKH